MHRILIADDEAEILDIMSEVLRKRGFEVIAAQSGEEALEMLAKEKIDLLILDKRMPGIGGIGVLKELKAKNMDLPVIILTGSQDTPERTAEFRKLGYNDFLFKPVDLHTLLNMVCKKLNIKTQELSLHIAGHKGQVLLPIGRSEGVNGGRKKDPHCRRRTRNKKIN